MIATSWQCVNRACVQLLACVYAKLICGRMFVILVWLHQQNMPLGPHVLPPMHRYNHVIETSSEKWCTHERGQWSNKMAIESMN